jgi:hypothetical protein
MMDLKFSAVDLFRSCRIALSFQRIWLQFIGLAVGYGGYYGFAVWGLLIADFSFQQIANRFGLFPCLLAATTPTPLVSKIVFGFGCLYLTVVLLITNIAVSRATFMMMKGKNFYSWREALMFSLRKSGSAVLTPIGIVVVIVVFVLSAWLVGFMGRIPYIGELGISALTLLWIFSALLLVFFSIVTAASILLTPAILATTHEDAFEAIFQSFSTVWSQPWRVIFYEAIVCAVSVVGFVILAVLVKSSFLLMNFIFGISMGEKFTSMAAKGQFILHSWIALLDKAANNLFGEFARHFYFSRDFVPVDLSFTEHAAAYIFAANVLIVGVLVISYLLATFNAGNTILFLILRKVRDGEDLLSRQEAKPSQEQSADVAPTPKAIGGGIETSEQVTNVQ